MQNITCNQMHPLYGALCSICHAVRVTRCAFFANRHTCSSIITLLCCWPCSIRRCGTGGFQEQGQCIFLLTKAARSFFFFYTFPFLFHLVLCGWGVHWLHWEGVNRSLSALHYRLLSNNNNNIKKYFSKYFQGHQTSWAQFRQLLIWASGDSLHMWVTLRLSYS